MSASETLQRLLRLLPLASREEGVELDEAARALGVDADRVVRDIDLLTRRSYYLPAGSTDDLQIQFDGAHLKISGPGMFTRPMRLTRGEMLALSVALRVAGMASDEAKHICGEIERELAGVERMERQASMERPPPAERSDIGMVMGSSGPIDDFIAPAAPTFGDSDGVRDTFSTGVLERRIVSFAYLKPHADEHEVRTLEPYRLLHAEGEWYVVGRDAEKDDLRLFRLDRVLGASLGHRTFEPDPDFDVSDLVREGQVALVTDEVEPRDVEIRYSSQVTRWVAERWEGRDADDGAYVVQHPVYDERWLMRTVMRYGGEARVADG